MRVSAITKILLPALLLASSRAIPQSIDIIDQPFLELEGHSRTVASLAFSADSNRLSSGGFDKTIKIWDPATGHLLKSLQGHSKTVTSVAFSPDGRLLASASEDKSIKLWDLETGNFFKTAEVDASDWHRVVYSHNGRYIASSSLDHPPSLRVSTTLEPALDLQKAEGFSVFALAFSKDDAFLASADRGGTIRIWDTASGTIVRVIEAHNGNAVSIAFSPDDRLLASGGFDRIVSGGIDKTIKLWEITTGKLLRVFSGPGQITGDGGLAFSPDGSRLITWDWTDGLIFEGEVATGIPLRIFETRGGAPNEFAVSPDGKWIAAGQVEGTPVGEAVLMKIQLWKR